MNIGKKISSASNPLIKEVQHLGKSKTRKEKGLFLVEGTRELKLALKNDYTAETVFYNEEEIDEQAFRAEFEPYAAAIREVVALSPAVFEKIAYRENGAVAVGVFHSRDLSLQSFSLSAQPLILVISGIEKPGNIGAMLRTANAAGVDAVLVCDPLADIFNPNCIRASLGAVFSTPVVTCTSAEAINWLKSNGIQVLVTCMQASVPHYTADMKTGTALVLGSEARGISEHWLKASDQNIIIPMSGEVDSLNVSNAAAIVLFEGLRQRNNGA